MKKLVLAAIFTFTMVLLFALNYLLWDRENRINTSFDKDANISALSREIKTLDTANEAFVNKINQLESTLKMLSKNNSKLQEERDYAYSLLNQKNNIISHLKSLIDTSDMESAIVKWADFIDKGQYEDAYKLQLNQFPNQPYISLEQFTSTYKTQIKKMKVSSVKLSMEDESQGSRGDLVFSVSLDVKKVPDSEKGQFEDGINNKKFTIIYSEEKNAWVIGDIQ